MRRTLQLRPLALDTERLGYLRFGEIAGRMLITNDIGEWELLSHEQFRELLAGRTDPEDPIWPRLVEKGFVRTGVDLNQLAERLGRKRHFLGLGPHLHVVITTLRCNQSCRYCHASRTDMDRVDTDMSLETAKKVVDFAMQSTSPYLNFEFQGGEPTVRMDVIRFVTEYSKEKNRYEGKTLDHSLVSNMTYMTEENAEWLLANGVLLCTSLDGPEDLHNHNRAWVGGGSAYDRVLHWMRYFNRRYVELGRDPELWHVDALLTTTRRTLEQWKEVVDLYVALGIRNIHLRPLNPFGFATKTWRAIGYSMEEFLAYYEQALDYIITLNLQGVQIMEGTAAVFLKKILTPEDPNFVDIRSPVGSGIGQLAYNYDGTILPSDEGRMIDAGGDPAFRIGDVRTSTYAEVIQHPTVRAMAAASYLDALPQCESCWNTPYCGLMPLHTWMQSRDLFGQRPLTAKHTQYLAISRMLFERLARDEDGRIEAIFRRWVINRPRLET